MKDKIRKFVDSALPIIQKELDCAPIASLSYDIQLPDSPEHGDMSINLAFKLSKSARKSPLVVADAIKKTLDRELNKDSNARKVIKKIEVAKPGFVNFFFSRGAGNEILQVIRKSDLDFGQSDIGGGKKVLIEFVSANPTGPLTIAHGRQAVVGDILARLFSKTGHNVSREYYLNDGGRQIRILGASVLSRYAELVGGTYSFPEDGYRGDYIKTLSEELQAKAGKKLPLDEQGVKQAVAFAIDKMMASIREDLDRLGVMFDQYFSEQSLYRGKIADSLELLKKKGDLFEEEGALWFRSSAYGDEKDRVVRKSTGEFTYLAPDIAYHREKFARGYQRLINLMGPDHHGYIARLKAACQALGYDAGQLDVLIVQLVTLYRGGEPYRMSTRAGEFVTLKELMDEVGVDATRVFFVQRKVESHLDFDVELAKKRSEDNPVYYLQYAHARISSILHFSDRSIAEQVDLALLSEPETVNLIKLLAEFPGALIAAVHALEPFRVLDYLRELAATFHKFYTLHRVVTEDRALSDARLFLVDAVRIVLRNGLWVLGVQAPEKM